MDALSALANHPQSGCIDIWMMLMDVLSHTSIIKSKAFFLLIFEKTSRLCYDVFREVF
jgi:hypothetical protein